MHSATELGSLQEFLHECRSNAGTVGLVPTMGNLHDGHLSLVSIARQSASHVVATIFVNPSQFGEGEDYSDYPRSLAEDKRKLAAAGCDLLFMPDVETIYPFGVENATRVTVPSLSEEFCGASRPGHFDGVASVVCRLLNIVQPDVAVFGEKDYQQLLVIRRMVVDLGMPVTIESATTRRADDGLALSSRNGYLSESQRELAPGLYATLVDTGNELRSGRDDYEQLELEAIDRLRERGFDPEYVGIRQASDLQRPTGSRGEFVILAAARLGSTRLIDNILLTR